MPKKKKWGKIGAPKSAKRRAHMKRIGSKGGRAYARPGLTAYAPGLKNTWAYKTKAQAKKKAQSIRNQGYRSETIPVPKNRIQHWGGRWAAIRGPKRKKRR